MTADYICIAAGPLIAMLVSSFKRLAFVDDHPKIVVAILSVITAVVSGLTYKNLDWQLLAQCLIVPFSTAVASFEVVKSATKGGRSPP